MSGERSRTALYAALASADPVCVQELVSQPQPRRHVPGGEGHGGFLPWQRLVLSPELGEDVCLEVGPASVAGLKAAKPAVALHGLAVEPVGMVEAAEGDESRRRECA